jgi:trehalose 6-phosphate phosphatase
MVRAPGITYVGNYGLIPGTEVDGLEALRAARFDAETALGDLPCVHLEDKGTGFALHYRNCSAPEAARLQVLELIAPIAAKAGARILEGKKVIELVPANLPDKLSAFQHLLQGHGVRGLVYLGDDLSDVIVFEEIARLREAGSLDGLGVAVSDEETDASVFQSAGTVLHSVDEVSDLLERLAGARIASRGDADD